MGPVCKRDMRLGAHLCNGALLVAVWCSVLLDLVGEKAFESESCVV